MSTERMRRARSGRSSWPSSIEGFTEALMSVASPVNVSPTR